MRPSGGEIEIGNMRVAVVVTEPGRLYEDWRDGKARAMHRSVIIQKIFWSHPEIIGDRRAQLRHDGTFQGRYDAVAELATFN